MLKPDEVKFLAVLVQRGHLDKGAAEQLFGELSASKLPKTLDQALLERGHFAADKLAFLKATGGEDVPIVPGFAYIARAGFGGTAVVFKGIEKATQRKVALKVMHRPLHADALQKRRFVREAKLLMRLDHPNIVRGVRVGHVKESDGSERLVFVLEWIDGRSLLELLREGTQFDEDTALFIILQAARALQYMHGQGVLHRDVKPDNILLTAEQQVKLIDLGFATELNQAEEGVGGDTTVGTAAYMSPEQARGISDLPNRRRATPLRGRRDTRATRGAHPRRVVVARAAIAANLAAHELLHPEDDGAGSGLPLRRHGRVDLGHRDPDQRQEVDGFR
jgi:serine/threonine protein kinase